jgi:hypothetical protein
MMADFARIDSNNIVIDVQHIADSDAPSEEAGKTFCHSLFDNDHPNCTYVKCDPDGAIRYNRAEPGDTYDSVNDAFRKPQRFSNWTEDSNFQWIPPIAKPNNPNAVWEFSDFTTGDGKWVDSVTNEDL